MQPVGERGGNCFQNGRYGRIRCVARGRLKNKDNEGGKTERREVGKSERSQAGTGFIL